MAGRSCRACRRCSLGVLMRQLRLWNEGHLTQLGRKKHCSAVIVVEWQVLRGGGGTMFCGSASVGTFNPVMPEECAATVNQAQKKTPDGWRNDVRASIGFPRH